MLYLCLSFKTRLLLLTELQQLIQPHIQILLLFLPQPGIKEMELRDRSSVLVTKNE